MAHVNIEIKARCNNPDRIRRTLEAGGADFGGTDHQTDTYFNVPHGRLKLHQGNIENSLIFYDRADTVGPKRADVSLFRTCASGSEQLRQTLTAALDMLVTVDKQREIYFIDNVKFHLDTVKDLGRFLEIEAIDESGSIGAEKLQQQCEYYMELFNIPETDLVNVSYSDMLIDKQ